MSVYEPYLIMRDLRMILCGPYRITRGSCMAARLQSFLDHIKSHRGRISIHMPYTSMRSYMTDTGFVTNTSTHTHARRSTLTNCPSPIKFPLGANRQSGKLFICKIAPERVMLLAMSSYKTNGGFQGPCKQRLGSHTKPGRSDWPYVANPTPKRRILQTESALVVHLSASVRQQRYQQCERNHIHSRRKQRESRNIQLRPGTINRTAHTCPASKR